MDSESRIVSTVTGDPTRLRRGLAGAIVLGAVAVLVGSWFVLPKFVTLRADFPQVLFVICLFATGPAALLVPLLRFRWGSPRFWLAMVTAIIVSAWCGVAVGYWVEQRHIGSPQWPGIGGALIVLFSGIVTAGFASLVITLAIPREDSSPRLSHLPRAERLPRENSHLG